MSGQPIPDHSLRLPCLPYLLLDSSKVSVLTLPTPPGWQQERYTNQGGSKHPAGVRILAVGGAQRSLFVQSIGRLSRVVPIVTPQAK